MLLAMGCGSVFQICMALGKNYFLYASVRTDISVAATMQNLPSQTRIILATQNGTGQGSQWLIECPGCLCANGRVGPT